MRVTLHVNEDHIKLLSALRFQRFNDRRSGIDMLDMYGGTFIYTDMANILGWQNHMVSGTEENPEGADYEPEYQQKLEEYADFMEKNLVHLEQILHQFAMEGGVKPGVYSCHDYDPRWSYRAE